MLNNTQFLKCLFGEFWSKAHVTDFTYDPNNIPVDKNLSSWKGDYFCNYQFEKKTNQYFTISIFHADDQGIARRRKSLYQHTSVIVLDDVKEKLPVSEVIRLPEPSWVLETSPGSEQWGYILASPCTSRHKVENLLDGLVANGLAPAGRDPGMKGVTRYVRLPEGYNNKADKLVDGEPFKCKMTIWSPFNTTTLEQLAKPFNVDLDAVRREARTDGAAKVDDHPILDITDLVHVKEIRSDGRFDVTCPWVDEHTKNNDSGSAIFTNDDGTIGFKCHHGACQNRTGKDLLDLIEDKSPGFKVKLLQWQMLRSFKDLPLVKENEQTNTLDQCIDKLRKEPPCSETARNLASEILKTIDSLPIIERLHWHNQIRDIMRWNKTEFKTIIEDLRSKWYSKNTINFFDEVVFIAEQNKFFDREKRLWYSPDAYQNTYAHLDAEARREALQGGRVIKVDKIDYAPKMPPIFTSKGVTYANSWSNTHESKGVKGDASRWINHFDTLGWGQHREHILQWMAHTILHPEVKINHILLLGSVEGCGKDWLVYPLVKAMGENHTTISGEELIEGYNDYSLNTKYLHVNEIDIGNRQEAKIVANKLKPLAAAPPDIIRINGKYEKHLKVRNIVNCSMATNSHHRPIRLEGASRRFFPVWSDLQVTDIHGNRLPEWKNFWDKSWEWMKNEGGVEACIWYLHNCVDLSNFNPGSPPPVTDFLKDIQESSKSAAQQTVEAFILDRIGMFTSDLLTATEMANTLRTGSLIAPGLMYCDDKQFSPSSVGNIMKNMPMCILLNAYKNGNTARIWVLRDRGKYKKMSPSELYDEYVLQNMKVKQQQPMTVVR